MNSDEADLKSFFDHSLDLMCIAGFDGYFKQLNPAWENTLGYSTEELMAQPYRAFIHPDDFARTEAEAARINTGANTIAFENRYRCKDGSYRWLEWRAQPDMDRQIIFAAARDTTRFKQLEDELRAKSALQRAMLDGANLAIISCRIDGIIQGFNVGAEQLLGYKAAEVIGKTSPSIFHDPQEVARRAASLTQELGYPVEVGFHTFVAKALLGPPDENEWTYIRKDGSRLPVMLTVTIMRDDSGQPTGYLGIASDLTAKRKAVRAQQELEARLQAILDNTTAVVFLKDRDGNYQMVNRRFEELFHLTREQMAGKSDYDIFPPEFARAFRDNDAKVLATGQAMVVEEIAPHAGVAHTYVSVKFPVLDTDGQVIALGGIATDITDRKRAEMELRDREARLSSILETAVEAIVTMDDKGLIQSINPAAAQIFGYQRGEIIGRNISVIVPAPHLLSPAHSSSDASAAPDTERVGQSRELLGRRKDGSIVPLIMSVSETHTGNRVIYTAIMHDITKRKRFEEDLRRSNQELEQFAYIASHDLQEPLRMITSYLQLLERRYKGELNEEAGQFIATAVDGAARMRNLIQDLLSYSRVGTRGRELGPVSCGQLIQSVLGDLEVSIKESSAVITADTLPTVNADELQLRQVFQNLVGNSIKFRSEQTPHIHISAQPCRGEWVISIRDNGIGIEPKFFDRIFVIFQRLHAREQYPGTGIGLALCKRIVERHHGQIWVDSSPGKGATFFFSLPS